MYYIFPDVIMHYYSRMHWYSPPELCYIIHITEIALLSSLCNLLTIQHNCVWFFMHHILELDWIFFCNLSQRLSNKCH